MNPSANNSSVLARILALTVCFFGLTAQLSAQRSDEQSLQGLRDIGLVVKYGEVNGQSAEWQSAALQALEDRARKRLQEAGINVLSTEESSKAGRTKLVFDITLNRVNSTADPIRVKASLYQRVRLSRDSAKEMELPTWSLTGGGGPEVTQKMLSDVFDGQVNSFLQTYKAANATATETSTEKIPHTSAQLSDIRRGFEGLNSTRVYVSIREDMFSDARQKLLQKFLQEAAESRLKEAGIKLIRYTNEAEQAGNAHLLLWIKLSQPNRHMWAPPVGVYSTFTQWVRLVRDPKKQTDAVTWESQDQGEFVKNSNGDLVITDDAVLELVNKQIDEFIKAMKAANANVTSAVPQAKSAQPRR